MIRFASEITVEPKVGDYIFVYTGLYSDTVGQITHIEDDGDTLIELVGFPAYEGGRYAGFHLEDYVVLCPGMMLRTIDSALQGQIHFYGAPDAVEKLKAQYEL